MKIYNNVVTIRTNEIENLKKILGVSKLTVSEVRKNKLRKRIKSVYLASEVRGKYRLRSYRKIYHDKSYLEEPSVVEIKEGGILLNFDLKKVYYDSTYANERALFINQLSKRNDKKEINIDVLYGGVGVLGFYLLRCPLVNLITVVDYNPSCKKWFNNSRELQPKRYRDKINFIESKVEKYLKETKNKISVCIAPLNKIPIKKLLVTYEEVYFYLLVDSIKLESYLAKLKNEGLVVTYRIAKEYSSSSAIYLFHCKVLST